MKIDFYINFLTFLTIMVGFITGFIKIVKDHVTQIEENTRNIKSVKKDLDILNRPSKLEGKIDILENKKK